MLHLLKLLLPALVPSWRFFKSVEASPRVHWTLDPEGASEHWQEFRPRPQHVSIFRTLLRLFWNPVWNETLYLVSCAERIQQEATRHSIQEIRARIWASLNPGSSSASVPDALRIRLVFVQRDGSDLVEQIEFESGRPV